MQAPKRLQERAQSVEAAQRINRLLSTFGNLGNAFETLLPHDEPMTRGTFAGDVSGPVRDFGNAYLDPSVFAGSLQSRLPAFYSEGQRVFFRQS